MNGVIYVEGSKNTKIAGDGKVDATYCSIEKTCSNTCPLKNGGCYAKTSYVGMLTSRLNKEAKEYTALQVAQAEAKVIDNSYNKESIPYGRDLRLHVSGDSKSIKGTRLINAAVLRWKKRGGHDVWSYSHSWQHVPRKEWKDVSILASIESTKQVKLARKQGYAPAIIVANHPTDKAYTLPGSNVKWIPCPAQTKPGGKQVTCTDCRLCMKADWLYATNKGIAFAAHGVSKNKIKKYLTVIQ